MTPAADGSIAQPSPHTTRLRNATRGAYMNGSVARAEANCAFTEGSRSSRRCHAGSPSSSLSWRESGVVTAAPALVMPLLNRRIQIHPPGNTWCTAAASTGYGTPGSGRTASSQRATPSKCV